MLIKLFTIMITAAKAIHPAHALLRSSTITGLPSGLMVARSPRPADHPGRMTDAPVERGPRWESRYVIRGTDGLALRAALGSCGSVEIGVITPGHRVVIGEFTLVGVEEATFDTPTQGALQYPSEVSGGMPAQMKLLPGGRVGALPACGEVLELHRGPALTPEHTMSTWSLVPSRTSRRMSSDGAISCSTPR
ncbi:hypothetical protein [Actinoplanes xinjiangensis]|uniref:hypothetical protein n=1 Tax=Actinoplanes xinjiangensis TaxID=512350 RepID=UPI0011B70365|nr:hypothetical protein [Actinoplanes xinjiangensis]